MPQGISLEEDVLKLIVYQFSWRVVVALDFIADDLHLLVYLLLGIGGVEDDVGEEVHGSGDMFLQDGGIIYRALLVGVGVEVASHALQAVEDMPSLASLGALEGDVLAEVSQSLFARLLVPSASVDLIAAIYHLAVGRQVDDAESIVECICIVFHLFNIFRQRYNYLFR